MNQKQKNLLTRTWMVCLTAFLCCALWGSAFPCVKVGYELFSIAAEDVASQIVFAGMRFALAGVLVIGIGSIVNRKFLCPKKSSLGMVGKLAMVQTVLQYLFFYVGLANTTRVKSSILVASNVFFSILIASLLFHYEKLTVPKITGCILGFAGVVIINLTGAGMDGGLCLTGEGFILFSALAYAFSSVLVKKYSAKEDPVALSGYQFLLGGIVLTACGLAMGGRVHGFTMASTGLLIYMAMISAVAYTLWSILLKFNPVSKVAVFGFMNPVCGVVLSALILNEKNQAFSVQGFAALVLVCIGIYQVNHVSEKG